MDVVGAAVGVMDEYIKLSSLEGILVLEYVFNKTNVSAADQTVIKEDISKPYQ